MKELIIEESSQKSLDVAPIVPGELVPTRDAALRAVEKLVAEDAAANADVYVKDVVVPAGGE